MPTLSKQNYKFDLVQAQKAWIIINRAQNITIISHRSPDPDTVGSNLTLHEILSNIGKNVTSACIDPLPQNCQFISQNIAFEQKLDLARTDLIISVDCGSVSQLGFNVEYPELMKFKPFINIDHHSSNNDFGTINIVSAEMSSTSEIVYQLLQIWEQQLTPQIATNLLFGIYFDTGSFMHTNTTPACLEIAQTLLKKGADHQQIIKNLYKNFSESKFNLWGDILTNFKLTDNNIITTAITQEDIKKHQSCKDDLSGIIDYLATGKETNYTLLINEGENNLIKGSLRTQNEQHNMSEIAKQFGGGGHKKASGFSLPGKIKKQTIWKIEKQVN
jgi:phosphoesterase RecJ-like protein